MEAFHNHDCDKCTHLLSTEYLRWAIDVYYCESRDLFGGSLILRLSDDPPDYWSSGLDTLHPGSRSLSYWSPVMRAIVETGYTGYVGQEFIPRNDPMTSLRKAVDICDV
jgi:hypothetical protein